jgi:hypothetical protein
MGLGAVHLLRQASQVTVPASPWLSTTVSLGTRCQAF